MTYAHKFFFSGNKVFIELNRLVNGDTSVQPDLTISHLIVLFFSIVMGVKFTQLFDFGTDRNKNRKLF
ncbi:hypothetical protein CI610_02046 [invertebrate metagenome]|uniref:Uncharacterized protein n=1 Tax=invertebrate metagenome TaxID=1711999 RepID=A0A2H9T719_9ZZZZ